MDASNETRLFSQEEVWAVDLKVNTIQLTMIMFGQKISFESGWCGYCDWLAYDYA